MGDWWADVSLAGSVSSFEFCRWWRFAEPRMLRRQDVVYVYSLKRCESGSRWRARGSNEQTCTTNYVCASCFCRFVPVSDCLCLLASGCSHNNFVWSPNVRTRSETTLWHGAETLTHTQKRKEALSVVSIIPACFWVRHNVAGKLSNPH